MSECPKCKGRKTYRKRDPLGDGNTYVDVTCSLCLGEGEIPGTTESRPSEHESMSGICCENGHGGADSLLSEDGEPFQRRRQ